MSNRASEIEGLVAGPAVRPIIPTDFDQATRIAKTAVKAGLFQADSEDKALAQATMAVLQGLELGIPPMQAVQQIAIIGGRCTIWGDLVPAMIWRAGHKIKEWIEGEGEALVAWCEIRRGDNGEVITRKFSVADAKCAGLWDKELYKKYPERMLPMRARGFCARDGVPDVLHGLYIREEIENEAERRPKESQDIPPPSEAIELLPPPAPDEEPDAPEGPALPSNTHAEAVINPGDFLSELDVSLAACRSEHQLDDVWAENVEAICELGMQPRQKAELMYDHHRARIFGQRDVLDKAAATCSRAAA